MKDNTNYEKFNFDCPVRDANGNLLSCGCFVSLSPYSAQRYEVVSIDSSSRCSLRRLGHRSPSKFLYPSSSLYFVSK